MKRIRKKNKKKETLAYILNRTHTAQGISSVLAVECVYYFAALDDSLVGVK